MSIFRNHKTSADRSASDRSRHKQKIKKAIREGVHHIVSDESIIGQDGKKRIKIPVRGIKEYRLIHGNGNAKRVGSAPGKKIRRGQKIGDTKRRPQASGSGKAGNEKGEEFYEVEITLEELSHYLFDSLELPDLEKKKFSDMVSEKFKRKGYRKKGIRPRLSKKETLKNKIRRKKAVERESGKIENEDFSFHESDLKYRHIDVKKKENSNAVLFFIMDTSGSMTKHKKFMARSFFFLLYHFIRNKYENTEIVFISHSVDAKEVTEDDFFKKGSAGGTLISSGLEKCLEIVDKRYHPNSWNLYTFHCSDGDNWIEDNQKAISLSTSLKEICQMYCYIQIGDDNESHFWTEGGMASAYMPLVDNKFMVVSKLAYPKIKVIGAKGVDWNQNNSDELIPLTTRLLATINASLRTSDAITKRGKGKSKGDKITLAKNINAMAKIIENEITKRANKENHLLNELNSNSVKDIANLIKLLTRLSSQYQMDLSNSNEDGHNQVKELIKVGDFQFVVYDHNKKAITTKKIA